MQHAFNLLTLLGCLTLGAGAAEEAVATPEPSADEITAQAAVAPRALLPEDGQGFRLYRVAFRVNGSGDRVQEIVGVHFPSAARLIPGDPDLAVLSVPSTSSRILSSRAVALPELLDLEPRALLPDPDKICDYVLKDVPAVQAARLPKVAGGFGAVGYYHRGAERLIFADKGRKALAIGPDAILEEKPRAQKDSGPAVKLPSKDELAAAKEQQQVVTNRLIESYRNAENTHTKLAASWEAYRAAYARAERLQLWIRDARMANLFDEARVDGNVRLRLPDGTDRLIPYQERNEEIRKELAKQEKELDALVAQMHQVRLDISRLQVDKRQAVKPIPALMSSLVRAQTTIGLAAPDEVTPFPAPPIEVLGPRTFLTVINGQQQRMAQFWPKGPLQPLSEADSQRSTTARSYETGDVNAPPPGTLTPAATIGTK